MHFDHHYLAKGQLFLCSSPLNKSKVLKPEAILSQSTNTTGDLFSAGLQRVEFLISPEYYEDPNAPVRANHQDTNGDLSGSLPNEDQQY